MAYDRRETNDRLLLGLKGGMAEFGLGLLQQRARELLEHFLDRVEKYNGRLNAIIWTDLDAARDRADEADADLGRGETWGPLTGLPMTVKESFNVAGSPQTWGVPALIRSACNA